MDSNTDFSFCGRIYGIDYIRVDNFLDTSNNIYFLSHVHSDHYAGLYNWDNPTCQYKTIYMTEESKQIFSKLNFRCKYALEVIVKVLETGKPHPIDKSDASRGTVTLIPVTHMPGAVMFLFKVGGKTILYTGDFVIEPKDIKTLAPLHERGKPIHIDLLYYDATFFNKKLPRRSDCIDDISKKTNDWLSKHDNNKVVIYTNYKYGYEELLEGIGKKLNEKVQIDDEWRLAIYRRILKDSTVYTDDSNARIAHHVQTKAQASNAYDKTNNYILTIRVTALDKYGNGSQFPTHCDVDQLQDFIKHFGVANDHAIPFKKGNAGVPTKKFW